MLANASWYVISRPVLIKVNQRANSIQDALRTGITFLSQEHIRTLPAFDSSMLFPPSESPLR